MKNSDSCKLCSIGIIVVWAIVTISFIILVFTEQILFNGDFSTFQNPLFTGIAVLFGILGVVTVLFRKISR